MYNAKFILLTFAMTTLTANAPAQQTLKSGISLTNFDKSVKPGDDFYRYACGGWMKNNPLPAAYSRYGSFDILAEKNNEQMRDILNQLQGGDYRQGTTERKLSDLYKLAMDSVRRNKIGTQPVQPILRQLEAAKGHARLFEVQLAMEPYGESQFVGIGYGPDEKNAKVNILNVMQGGITLGEKEYYLDDDPATKQVREAYKRYVEKMFRLYGFSAAEAKKKMQSLLQTETTLAKASRTRAERRDPEKNYNKMTLAQFASRYPALQLDRIMQVQGVDRKHYQDINVGQPEYVDAVNSLLANISDYDYRTYMEWGVINGSAAYLSDATEAARFEFFGKEKAGRATNHPLWKRSLGQVENQMGEALGKIYVSKYFPASSKERMKQLIDNLKTALAERIKAQDWMTEATKKNALAKLATFYVKIGYPDKWTDFSALNIDPQKSYYDNIRECQRFWNKYWIDEQAGKPVDKDRWYMHPQTVNAYYNPPTNEICFPAGILQPPFFDADADDAFNYGAIGVVIGHEMTHGFDDQGRKFDKDGNMNEWWTEDDAKRFQQRADKYADFFSAINVLPDLKANGRLTLGENIADHGGLQLAYCALGHAMEQHPLADADGFTPRQRFFLAYANVWAQNITEKEMRNRTLNDPHSLGEWRVNGALPHIDAWYDAFNIDSSSKLFLPKQERLQLW